MTTVVCIKWGTKYNAAYVNKLAAAVDRNMREPHRFVCVTEDATDVKTETLPLPPGLHGWWNKMRLFAPTPFGLDGQLLFLDLDVVITGSLDDVVRYPMREFAMHPDFQRPVWASAVMVLQAGSRTELWDAFEQEQAASWKRRYWGDQEFISAKLPPDRVELLPRNWIVSYKNDIRKERLPKPPDDARVVCFHGNPKPHEVNAHWVERLWNQSN